MSPTAARRVHFGGDYNPEQWPRDVWHQDMELMRAAGVTLATVGVFSWAQLEPAPGSFQFGWLDDVMDRLHANGVGVDLATATASPPPWLSRKYPETLPVTADGVTLSPGGRQAWCPSSPVFRDHASALTTVLAERYVDHPALQMWHVGNEFACHNPRCYCDVSAIAFRSWLVDRYGDIDELNDAWGTAFWSQRYGSFDEVLPPRAAPAFVNPTQQLDFRRFSSDEHLACFVAERDILRRLTPEVPVTTNFMTHKDVVDYWSWAAEVDVVANDHYIDPSDPESHVGLAFCADLTRGLAGGKPWLLMEHSTSAVNWRARNAAKQPGQMLRNSLQHLCRGADGIMFFQWRASEAGAEKFHSAMVPHAGPDSRVFREVCQLGSQVAALGDVAGSVVSADVAIVFDYQSWWASGLDAHPTVDVDYPGQALELYRALWSRNITVDFVRPGTDLAAYHLVVVPNLYLVEDQAARLLAEYVDSGGHLVVTYFSGIVDEHDHVRLGGYPGAFRELLGIRTEEFFPLAEGQCVSLSDGSTATVWTERTHVNDADVLARFVDGPAPGSPAVTRRRTDTGSAWYLGTRLHRSSTQRWVDTIVQEAGVVPGVAAPEGLEVVTRHGDDWSYTFAINHTDGPLDVELASGLDLLEDMEVEGRITVAPGSVRVLRHARHGAGCS